MDTPIEYDSTGYRVIYTEENDEIFITIMQRTDENDIPVRMYRVIDKDVAKKLWRILCDLIDEGPDSVNGFYLLDETSNELSYEIDIILE